MRLIKLIIVLSIIFLVKTSAYGAVFSFEAEPDTGTAVFPRGTMFKAILQNTVSSKLNEIGDPVSLILSSDLVVGKSICLPEGSVFIGEVVELNHAQEGRDGYFRIALTQLVFPDGWRTPIAARIIDTAATDIIGGKVTERTEYRKIPHNIEAIGHVVQLVKAGPREMGEERTLNAGKELLIVLDRDLQVKYLEKF